MDKQIKGDDKENLSNIESDVSGLVKHRKDYINNPSIGYLNINNLSEKIIYLREICLKTSIDILCVDETKLDSSYPNAQFHIDGYQFPPFRRDRNNYGGGKMVYIRDRIIAKRLENLEGKHSETICLELTVSKKKWCITFAYRPPSNDNKAIFFYELTTSLSQITNLYDYFVIMGDLNIDTSDKTKDTSCYLSDLCDTFSLKNVITGKTCFKKTTGTSIDILLTNRLRSFLKTGIFETGLSDHHKLILSFFRSCFSRIPPKTIQYRKYKTFKESSFLYELDQELLKGDMYKNNRDMFSTFTETFRRVLDKHAPLKTKRVRGNQSPFMTKELSKAVMNKSKTRNKYIKWPSRENVLAMKRAINYCNNLTRTTKNNFFQRVTKSGFANNKKFWNAVKPFLTNKDLLTNDNISIKVNDDLVTDKTKLANLFNLHYINIVENTSGAPPVIQGNPNNPDEDNTTVKNIIKQYENHNNIINIKNHIDSPVIRFDIPTAKIEDINKIIKNINLKKATGPDKIPPKIVKLSANIIDSHLMNIIDNDLSNNSFSNEAKVAAVRPIYKKKSHDKIENYRPVSILSCFSKFYEKFLLEKFKPFINTFLSKFIAGYRENYSSSHVLIRLIENWKQALDENFVVGTVLMDLSKAFDCIPHDLLIAKLYAYGFSEKKCCLSILILKKEKTKW